MDWVHCNKCFVRPSNKINFEFTSCGHIICVNCKKSSNNGKCLVCSVQCTAVPLTSPLPSQVEPYFTDPMAAFRKVRQIYQFQEENRKRLQQSYLMKAEATLQELDKKVEALLQEKSRLETALTQAQSVSNNTGQVFYTKRTPSMLTRTPSSDRPILTRTPSNDRSMVARTSFERPMVTSRSPIERPSMFIRTPSNERSMFLRTPVQQFSPLVSRTITHEAMDCNRT